MERNSCLWLSPALSVWNVKRSIPPKASLCLNNFAATSAFLRDYDQYEKYCAGRLVVILKETGETLGWCGLYPLQKVAHQVGRRPWRPTEGAFIVVSCMKIIDNYKFSQIVLPWAACSIPLSMLANT